MTELKILSADEIIIWLIIAFFAAIIFVGVVNNVLQYLDNIDELKRLMYCSDSEDEYRYWKRELRICRLCIIPGLTPHRIKKILGFFGRK